MPAGVRPLAALSATLGALPGPSGMRAEDGEVTFLFVVPGPFTVPLPEWARAQPRAWALYVDAMLGGWEPPTQELDVFYFGDGPELAARLAHLVVKGEKRGTSGWCAATEKEGQTIPRPGLVSIVTDGFGLPLCAIQTERVERGRFRDATAEIARAEGEGDRTLEDWREGHRRFFEREAAAVGLVFDDDAELFHEYFRVLKVFGGV